jgi:biotin carboxyl carrier protein
VTDPAGGPASRLTVRVDGTAFIVEVEEAADGGLRVRVDGRPAVVDSRLPRCGPGSLLLDGISYLVDLGGEGRETHVVVDGEAFGVQIESPARRRCGPGAGAGAGAGGGQRLVAPMPGKVVAVLVEVGQPVEPGAGLVILEAMKMENEFRATAGGVVTEVHVAPGQAVNAGDLLVVIA